MYETLSYPLQESWKESEQKAKTFERERKASFKKAQQITAVSPATAEKIFEAIPEEKKQEIVRRLSKRKPARWEEGGL